MNTLPDYNWNSSAFHNDEKIYWTPLIFVLPLLVAFLTQRALSFFDRPLLSIPEIVWNAFVWVMPKSLVYSLRPGVSSRLDLPHDGAGSSEHAAKSEVLRDVFKLPSQATLFGRKRSNSKMNPPGLGNWDNSCYQNSVLQALASLEGLQGFYRRLEQRGDISSADSTLGALKDLTDKLNHKSTIGQTIWTSPRLKSMSSWQQQDAQEYYSKLMDDLEKDIMALLRRKSKPDTVSDLSSIFSLENKPMNSERQDSGIAQRMQKLLNPLEGLLAQRVGCTRCGYVEGLSLIPFNCVTLPLGRDWNYDLSECLNEYTKLEMIEGVECAKCSLLQARHYLRRQTELVATAPQEEKDEVPAIELQMYKEEVTSRLVAVSQALQDDDFSDNTMLHKCRIGRKQRVCSTKSKQCMIMRAPQCLVMHIQRSMFDESTGDQLKNYADVRYQEILDLSQWCVGKKVKLDLNEGGGASSMTEEWEMDPTKSMSASNEYFQRTFDRRYKLSAAVTHHGRHENGHYICFRRSPAYPPNEPEDTPSDINQQEGRWWRLSDDDVRAVTEEEAYGQGGVFMLFYELVETTTTEDPKALPVGVEKCYTSVSNTTPEIVEVSVVADPTDEPSVVEQPMETDSITQARVNEPAAGPITVPAVEQPSVKKVFDQAKASAAIVTVATSSTPTSSQGSEDLEVLEDEATSSVTETRTEAPRQTFTPPTMRTAGNWQRSPEETEAFKVSPMVAIN